MKIKVKYTKLESKYIISENINQKQTVSINDKDNLCHQQSSLNNTFVINNDCYVLAIVKCEGIVECTYQILNINEANEILLVEK
jgi:CTP:phosphocholine cytidylyltransferase-like protein